MRDPDHSPSCAELMGAPRDSEILNKGSVPGYVNFDAGDSTTVFVMTALHCCGNLFAFMPL